MFGRVAFIGIGLIGSSIARVMRRDNLAGSIIACARTDETLDAAKRLNIADETTKDIAEAVRDADLVMICTPVSTYGAIAEAIARAESAILTDVGSVKDPLATAVMPHLPKGPLSQVTLSRAPNSGPEAGFGCCSRDVGF